MSGDTDDRGRQARRDVAAACAAYADAYEQTAGSIVTGYITVMELTGTSGIPFTMWITGNGADPRDGNEEGLANHRCLGLLESAHIDIRAGRGDPG